MENKPILLTFKWTVSRGRDTYGYNICSLYADGSKVASTNGGGYDMQGTVLAMYLQREYQEQLMTVADRAHSIATQDKAMQWMRTKNEDGLYGMQYLKPSSIKPHVCLDGGCGQSSIEKIAKAAGITLTSTKIGRGHKSSDYGYFLTV